jgi:hypothetical protein
VGLYSQGTEAEVGIFSDLSGGHEYEEYMGFYSQVTEAEGGIFSNLSGGHDNVESMWVYTPKGLRLRVEYSLTYLEDMNMKNI